MRKFLSATVGAAIALSAIAITPHVTIEEAKAAIEAGNAIQPTFKMRTKTHSAIKTSTEKSEISTLSNNKKRNKVPARVTAGGSNIYGYLGYTTEETNSIGLYTIDQQGYSLKWADPAYESDGFVLSTGWFSDNKLCGFAPVEFFGYILSINYFEYEFETGNILVDREADMDNGMFSSATYNPDDKCIYGFGEHTYEGISFLKADAATPDKFECVKSLADSPEKACTSIAFNCSDHKLYGTTAGGSFVSIAPDGTQTEIMELSDIDKPEYVAGLVYSPIEDVFFWNLITYDSSYLYKIDIKKKTLELVENYGTTTFPIFFTTDDAIDPAAPAMPETVSTGFSEGSVSGAIVYTLPTLTNEGNAIQGNLDWTAMLDQTTYKTGQGAPGSNVTIEYTDLTEGMHTFAFYASANSVDSRINTNNLYIGNDTPASPKNVTLSTDKLSWSPVTEGANGGYIDTEAIEYEAFLNGQSIGKTKADNIAVEIPDATLTIYEASVIATYKDKSSEPGISNTIISGKPFTPDVSFVPTENEAKLFTIVDVDNNDNTWFYDIMYDVPSFTTDYDDYAPMNDWLFLPPVELSDIESYYKFSMDCRRRGNSYEEEYMEVCIGTSPEPSAMTTVLIPKTTPNYSWDWEEWDQREKLFKVDNAGTYYIGIHCMSEPRMYGVVVRNLSISDPGITDESPSAVTGAVATPAENGVLKATVSFTLPTTTIVGTTIAADKELVATVSAGSVETVTGKPGDTVNVTVETAQGDNNISIVVSAGEAKGIETTVGVFTGIHIPNVVKNLTGTISDDMLSFVLTWDCPTNGEDGGYIDPASVGYSFYTYDELWGWQKAKDLGTDRTYTFTVPAGTEQDLFRMGIATYNVAGECSHVTGLTAVMGMPYTLPMSEDFEGESNDPFQINPWIYYTPDSDYDDQRWSPEKLSNISSDWANLTTSALVGTYGKEKGKGRMAIPRFSTIGAYNIEIMLDTWAGNNAANISITGIASGIDKEVTMGSVLPGNSWKKSFISLPEEFNGRSWVQLYIETEYNTAKDMCVIESLEVTGSNTSDIDAVSTNAGTICGGKGIITVAGFDDCHVSIFTVDGKTIANDIISQTEQSYTASPGLYIVKVGDTVRKVIVK